jgi:hypothetical protein
MWKFVGICLALANLWTRQQNCALRSDAERLRRRSARERRERQAEADRKAQARLDLAHVREQRLQESARARLTGRRLKTPAPIVPRQAPSPAKGKQAPTVIKRPMTRPSAIWTPPEPIRLALAVNQHGRRVCNGCGRAVPDEARFCAMGCGSL